jgi:hypothetical protein
MTNDKWESGRLWSIRHSSFVIFRNIEQRTPKEIQAVHKRAGLMTLVT